MSQPPEIQAARVIRCPSCRRSTRYDVTNPDRPFCSPRCKNADIAAWAEESFRIPGRYVDPDEEDMLLDPKDDGAGDED